MSCPCPSCVNRRAAHRRHYEKNKEKIKAYNRNYKRIERAKMKAENISDSELDRRAMEMK